MSFLDILLYKRERDICVCFNVSLYVDVQDARQYSVSEKEDYNVIYNSRITEKHVHCSPKSAILLSVIGNFEISSDRELKIGTTLFLQLRACKNNNKKQL